jgi:hypothetical protein
MVILRQPFDGQFCNLVSDVVVKRAGATAFILWPECPIRTVRRSRNANAVDPDACRRLDIDVRYYSRARSRGA